MFQLIDFGLAQHERPEGGFPPDCTTGDSGYVCQQFMSTAQPDYSADLCSFGLTLFECMSGSGCRYRESCFSSFAVGGSRCSRASIRSAFR